MDYLNELPLEVQLSIANYKHQLKNASHQQAQELAAQTFEQLHVQRHLFMKLLRNRWGISSTPNTTLDIEDSKAWQTVLDTLRNSGFPDF